MSRTGMEPAHDRVSGLEGRAGHCGGLGGQIGMRVYGRDCGDQMGREDSRLALVLDMLGPDDIRTLLLFPPAGVEVDAHLLHGLGDSISRLHDLDVIDPSGLVSFRVALVEPCADGVRLSRLGRAAVARLLQRRGAGA